jgi:D-amino-acid dehydrogenase
VSLARGIQAPGSVAVIGAGIVGISCGIHLQSRGHRVTLLDPRGFGNGASYGNSAIVANSECLPVATPGTLRRVPSMLLSRDGPLHIRPSYLPALLPWLARFVAASRPARVRQISLALSALLGPSVKEHQHVAALAGIAQSIEPTGWMKAYESVNAFERARPDYEAMRKLGVPCEELGPEEIRAREPALASIFKRAIFHPGCQHVGDPHAYTAALGAYLMRQGATFREAAVTGFSFNDGSVAGVTTADGTVAADIVVVACGAWSKALAAQLGERVPLDTERGYHAMFSTPGALRLHSPVYWADRSVILSPMPTGLRMTSSVEFAGLHAEADFTHLNRLAADLRRAVPSASAEVSSRWLGFRPSMPDSLPVIGRTRQHANCFLAFGHGHLGLTLGPVTGRMVADLVEGVFTGIDASPYAPQRFQ